MYRTPGGPQTDWRGYARIAAVLLMIELVAGGAAYALPDGVPDNLVKMVAGIDGLVLLTVLFLGVTTAMTGMTQKSDADRTETNGTPGGTSAPRPSGARPTARRPKRAA